MLSWETISLEDYLDLSFIIIKCHIGLRTMSQFKTRKLKLERAEKIEWPDGKYKSRIQSGVCMLSYQSYLTFCDSVDCSPPGSSTHWIFQARILEWTAFSKGSSWPRDWTWVYDFSCIAGRFFTAEPPGKPIRSGDFLNMAFYLSESTLSCYTLDYMEHRWYGKAQGDRPWDMFLSGPVGLWSLICPGGGCPQCLPW